jgi:malonate-semialdehyde dehydrogenase (acetylating)/methylmalonate-semialdehyde dehydrogenase
MTAMPESIRIRNYIDGQWIDEPGVKTIPLFNPSDGKQIGEVPLSTEAASRKAIESCHTAYEEWRRQPIARRVKYLFDLRRAMEERREDLAFAIAIAAGAAFGTMVIPMLLVACKPPSSTATAVRV